MRRHRFTPTTSARLEDRTAPSQIVAAQVATLPHTVDLEGTIQGFDIARSGLDILRGSGTVSPLGPVQSFGFLQIRSGEPTFYEGDTILFGHRGDLVVRVHGIVGGPSRGFAVVSYDVEFGTGAYYGDTGHGYAIFQPSIPSPVATAVTRFALTFVKFPPPIAMPV